MGFSLFKFLSQVTVFLVLFLIFNIYKATWIFIISSMQEHSHHAQQVLAFSLSSHVQRLIIGMKRCVPFNWAQEVLPPVRAFFFLLLHKPLTEIYGRCERDWRWLLGKIQQGHSRRVRHQFGRLRRLFVRWLSELE